MLDGAALRVQARIYNMNRVYTDERFPEFEIHNNGNNQFHVYSRDESGELTEVEMFTTYSEHPEYKISEDVARRMVDDYFARMESHRSAGDEFLDVNDHSAGDTLTAQDERIGTEEDAEGAGVSIDDLLGDNIVTADYVVDAYEKAKAIKDPTQREAALKQVSSMARQMESAARELVRRLIG